MPKKKPEDLEIERRVRGRIRQEMTERGLGVNAAGRRLGLSGGTLSRILNEQRGFGSGFILIVQRAFSLPAKMILEEDPDARFMEPGTPDIPEVEQHGHRKRRSSKKIP